MLTLLCGNPKKYAALGDLLERLGIILQRPPIELPEIQDEDLLAVLAHKARAAHDAMGGPCLVDDAALLLDDYPGFPGPLTRSAIRLLGPAGFERLMAGTASRARLVCSLGCTVGGRLWHWHGEIAGRLDPTRPCGDGPGPLTQWFIPDDVGDNAVFGHRRRALEALGDEIDRLRAALAAHSKGTVPFSSNENRDSPPLAGRPVEPACREDCDSSCVFCAEFDGTEDSIYHKLLGGELPSRIVRETDHFLVFPPLGQFIEGGLLLASREHLLSMAHLPAEYYAELESLVEETARVLQRHYGCRPVFFEHAPIAPGVKGTCCVDHAHLNVFPVDVDVHAVLRQFPHHAIGLMSELAMRRQRGQPYLFLQAGDGKRYVYEPGVVPSQLVRKIIAAQLGMPERGHWRDYLGLEELKRTAAVLSGWRSE